MLMRFTVNRGLLGCRSALAALLAVAGAGLLVVLFGVVASARASSSCPNEIYRTGPGANLPDCRAYEMVSPPNKNGGEVDGGPVLEGTEPAPEQASANGEVVTYGSQTTFTEADPLSGLLTTQYLSRRGPSGWYTQAITPAQDVPAGVLDDEPGALDFSLYWGFSEDLEHGFLLANDPAPVAGAPAHYYNPYLRDDADGSYQLLSTVTPPVASPGPADKANGGGLTIEYAGMSADGTHVVFSASDALTPNATPGQENLYEWSDGRLELVNVLPDGEVAGGTPPPSYTNLVFGRPSHSQGGLNEDYQRVISANGSRVIWTDEERQLYDSELTPSGERITRGPLPGQYETASVDGSVVYTSDEGQLDRYEVSTEKLSELTAPTARVTEVLGASEDGSYVYFVAKGALAAGASNGLYNIYLWHDGAISLVAAVGEGDYSARSLEYDAPVEHGSAYLLESNTTRVSPDGRYLAFEASEPLTGYDNVPTQAGACEAFSPGKSGEGLIGGAFDNHTGRCLEVYEYDADAGRLTCASCNPRGLPPVGNSFVPVALHNIVTTPGWQSATVQQRYLLDDGRLFFDSIDDLLPQASNAGQVNVYEYEPGGVGSCQREEGGCLGLISSGTSSDESLFMDASASGSDVFFLTRQQLVAQDGDEAMDVYDARVGGGFSAATPPPCGGEACRPPVTPAPAIYQAPPSATFAGPGNPPQPAGQPSTVKPSKKKAKRKGSKPGHKAKRKKARRARSSRVSVSAGGSRR